MPSSPSVMVPSTNNDDDGDLSVPNSFSNASLSWDQLRRQARQVENEIELKLATLSKLGASVSSPPSTSPDAIAMNSLGKPSQELETEELLRKVSNQLDMDYIRLLHGNSYNPSSHPWDKYWIDLVQHLQTLP